MIRLGNFSVVLDACVLYDSIIRDFLLCIAEKELYRPVWSLEICKEVERNLSKKIGTQKAEKLVKVINQAFPEAITLNEISCLELKGININTKDIHVLTTAICSEAQVILTYNVKDFPSEDLRKFSIEALTPDVFLINLLNLSFFKVLNTFKELEQHYKNPPIPRETLFKWYQARVPSFMNTVIPYLDGSITKIY